MLDDHLALLLAIRDDMLDDSPRLIFADWLEENGHAERAEFIRVQCEIARLEFAHNWDPGRCTAANRRYPWLKKRERELLNQYQAQWVRPLQRPRVIFYRGFLHLDPWMTHNMTTGQPLGSQVRTL